MPGKKDPEYIPLNINVDLFEYENQFPKYESLEDEISTDDEMTTRVSEVLRSRSGSNTSRTTRVRNVSLNMTQNSDDEEEGSMQSSSDLDVEDCLDEDVTEVDMMDTLVLNIREKLRMDPKYCNSSIWNSTEPTPPPTPFDIHDVSSHSNHSTSVHLRRRRMQPYQPNSLKSRNPLTSVQKKQTKNYWTNTTSHRGKDTPRENPYELLQQLLQSGSLIKEAVRRLSIPKGLGRSSPLPITPINNHNPPSVIHLSPPKSTIAPFS